MKYIGEIEKYLKINLKKNMYKFNKVIKLKIYF